MNFRRYKSGSYRNYKQNYNQDRDHFLDEIIKEAESYVGGNENSLAKISSMVKDKLFGGNKLYKLSATKAIAIVGKANNFYFKVKNNEDLNDSEVLLEAAKLVYIGSKNTGEGKSWFNLFSSLLEKVAEEKDKVKKRKWLVVMRLISTYLAAYSKS